MPDLISVVIPTYQRRSSVERLLAALNRQTFEHHCFEVVVVVDGAEDGTRELVAQFNAPYRLRGLWQTNRGRAAACNAGISAASGELIVLLDDDMEPAPGCLAGHAAAHVSSPQLAVVGAAPIRSEPTSPPLVKFMSAGFRHRLERFAQPGYQIQFSEAYSGNFSIRRAQLLAVEGFDEAFKVYGYEDYELAMRLTQAGVRLAYSAAAVAEQSYDKDFAGLARDTINRGRSGVLFARKHPEVRPALKLGRYSQASPKWRWLRAGLLQLSRHWTTFPAWVIRFIQQQEQRQPANLDLYYNLALDYFYWLGVQSAEATSTLNSVLFANDTFTGANSVVHKQPQV